MADQVFDHPEQVRGLLAATIGTDVFNEMERQDPLHRVGNPLPPPPADPAPAAAPAPAAPPAAPQASPAPVAAPAAAPADTTAAPATEGHPGVAEKLVLGKYKTEKEAEDAYHRLLHANKELMRQLEVSGKPVALQSPVGAQQPTAPATESNANPRDDLFKSWNEKYGVEAGDLEALKAFAREAVLEEIGPEREWRKAEAFMAEQFPDSTKFQAEIAQYVATDPNAGAVVNSLWQSKDYKGAMMTAYSLFDQNRRASAERAMLANETVRQEEVAEARKDAGLITSQVGGVHEAPVKQYGPSPEEQKQLENLYRAGHKEPWLRANLGNNLPDELFGVGQ